MDKLLDLKGNSLPKIGLGTYQLTGKEGQRSVEEALSIGYRHLDTAQLYDNEVEVGTAIRNSDVSRDQIFLTTKIWTADFDEVLISTEESLRRLQTDHVDLLLLHWPSEENARNRALEQLNEVLHKQYAKAVGVSNFTIPLLEQALEFAPIACNQVEYHAFLSQDKLLEFMRPKGLVLEAYRPLSKGKLTQEPLFTELAEVYGKSPAQIALRWLIQQDSVVAIPKASSENRLRENLDVFDFELKPGDIERINTLPKNKRMVDPEFAPVWD